MNARCWRLGSARFCGTATATNRSLVRGRDYDEHRPRRQGGSAAAGAGGHAVDLAGGGPSATRSLTVGFGPITLNRCVGHGSFISRPRVQIAHLSPSFNKNPIHG
ncbi:MAG: hypothetical protein C0483_04220 [Pirellula sp.]|nr:hypothetical protein [Pirellula sp.]